MLQVVEHQQKLFLAQEIDQLLARIAAGQRDSKRFGYGQRQSVALSRAGRRQGHKPDPVEEPRLGCRGHLQRQPGFARAAWTEEGQQPGVGGCQQAEQISLFALTADKARRRRGQIVARTAAGGADALVEGGGLVLGLGVEGLAERAATGDELSQGGAALSGAGQRQHQVAVRFLAPGVHGEKVRGGLDGGRVVAQAELELGQRVQRLLRQLAQPQPLGQHPVLKVGGIVNVKAIEEVAAIQGHRLPKLGGLCGGRLLAMGERGRPKRLDVEEGGDFTIEGDRLARDEEVRLGHFAQVG